MNTTPTLKRVLLVDDSPDDLDAVRRGLAQWCYGAWELVLAHEPLEALKHLDAQAIDLVVVSAGLSSMDVVQFLKLAGQHQPNARRAALTESASTQARGAELIAACDVCLARPHTAAEFESCFRTLDRSCAALREGFRGVLRKVSLTDLITLECLNRRTSVLEMTALNLRGQIYIKEGDVVHAQAGSKTGAVAFLRLMKMPGGDFHLMPFTEPPNRTIHANWEQLLMEAAQAMDETSEAPRGSGREEDTAWVLRPIGSRPTPALAQGARPGQTNALRHPRAVEALIVNENDGTVFEWQCTDAGARLRFLRAMQEKCGAVCAKLKMGKPQLVDLPLPAGRAVAHFQASRRSFCRTEYQTAQTLEVNHA